MPMIDLLFVNIFHSHHGPCFYVFPLCILIIKLCFTMLGHKKGKIITKQSLLTGSTPLEHSPAEICTSATILSGLWKGKGWAASLATACIISSQNWSRGSGSSRVLRFSVGTVRMMLSVASSPQGPTLSWIQLFHSSSDVFPGSI